MATQARPTLDTLPPELRLQIYTHHLNALLEALPAALQHSTHAKDHPVFNPPLLQTSHQIRDEAYPLYLRALQVAQKTINDSRTKIQGQLQSGACFAWDKRSKSFMGGCSGVEVWGVYMRLEGLVTGLEGMEGKIGKWIASSGSRI